MKTSWRVGIPEEKTALVSLWAAVMVYLQILQEENHIVDWWDALIMDCLWFCHSKKVIIPGTEGMKYFILGAA